MTVTERKKLAKAARELASEFAEGRGPKLDPASFCGCAAGEVVKRAGIQFANDDALSDDNSLSRIAADLDNDHGLLLTAATWAMHGRDYFHIDRHNEITPLPGAAVFPLLALADELES